jgi:hypothetical protein
MTGLAKPKRMVIGCLLAVAVAAPVSACGTSAGGTYTGPADTPTAGVDEAPLATTPPATTPPAVTPPSAKAPGGGAAGGAGQPRAGTTTPQRQGGAAPAAPPRSAVPAALVGTWDGGSKPNEAKLTFFAGGDVRFRYNSGLVVDGTVVVQGSSMTMYLDRGPLPIRRWTISEIDAGSGYRFLNLDLDGFSYVRDVS